MLKAGAFVKVGGKWDQLKPGPVPVHALASELAGQTAGFGGFYKASEEISENGKRKETWRNAILGVEFSVFPDKSGMLSQLLVRSLWVSVRSNIRTALKQIETLNHQVRGKEITTRPFAAQYLVDKFEFDREDLEANKKANERMFAIRQAIRDMVQTAEAYETAFGVRTVTTVTSISFAHPLLSEGHNRNNENPLPPLEIGEHYAKILASIHRNHSRSMANLASLEDHGFTIGEQSIDGKDFIIIARPDTDNFEPVRLPLKIFDRTNLPVPIPEEMYGFLIQDPTRRIAALKSSYPIIEELPEETTVEAATTATPEAISFRGVDVPDAPIRLPRPRPVEPPKYLVTTGGIKIPFRKDDYLPRPAVAFNSSQFPVDTELFDRLYDRLATLTRVTLIFDSSSLRILAGMRSHGQDTQRVQYYFDALRIAEKNPALHFMGYPSAVVDLELQHRITNSDELGDGHFRNIIHPEGRNPIALEARTATAEFFGTSHRWQTTPSGAEHFVAGAPESKNVVWETPGQNEFYQLLLEDAKSNRRGSSDDDFAIAFMDARRRLGHNMGETVCVDTAIHYNGNDAVIIVSDDKGCAKMVRKLNAEEICTRAGRGIGWMPSGRFLDALDVSCEGALAEQLDRMSGMRNGNRARYDSILDDFDDHSKRILKGVDDYREMQRKMPPSIVGKRRGGAEEITLEEALCAGSDVAQLMANLKEETSTAFFMQAKLAPNAEVVVPLARQVWNRKTDIQESRLVF